MRFGRHWRRTRALRTLLSVRRKASIKQVERTVDCVSIIDTMLPNIFAHPAGMR